MRLKEFQSEFTPTYTQTVLITLLKRQKSTNKAKENYNEKNINSTCSNLGSIVQKENTTSQSNCNCGMIIDDNVSDYSVTISNQCSGNTKKFYLNRGDWVNAFVGSDYCITNSGQW